MSLGVWCNDGCTITLDKQDMSVQNNGNINNQRHQKQEDWNVGIAPWSTTIINCGKKRSGKNVQTRTSTVFTCSTIQTNYSKPRQGNQTRFPEDVAGPHRNNRQEAPWKIKEYNNVTHAHEKIKATIKQRKPPDTDFEENIKTNVVFFTTVDPSKTKVINIYSDLCVPFPTTSSRGGYIYVMYVCDCNAILTKAIKNKSDK